ncbi:MAG: zinc ribbon domain-containing protein [Lachnospiraceae bacterium]|nr:zinc ribbon domain-containing protein [Lachnospiraceae bacterium]
MNCPKCGKNLSPNKQFCIYCGSQIKGVYPGNGIMNGGNPIYQGYSKRVDDPEIKAALKKHSRVSGIFGIFIIPLPIIGFVIYSNVTEKITTQEALKYGIIVSVVFLIITIISSLKMRVQRPYEGVVIDKKIENRYVHNNSDKTYMETEYIMYVRTDTGAKKKIVEREGSLILAFNYLNIGDRFKYHPGFAFPYELYDKSRAKFIYCVVCGKKNSFNDDRCIKCNVPLLK